LLLTKQISLSEKRSIGLLGVGLVGSALGARLIAAGYPVCGYDPVPDAGPRLASLGGRSLASEREVGRECRRLVLSLPTSDDVDAVMAALDDELAAGDLIIDTTTGDPERVEHLAQSLQARGIEYLDASLGGSSRQIALGEGIVMCGATDFGFAAAGDLLRNFGSTVFHTGLPGSGTRMKLVLNMVLGLQRAILAEGLEFARRSGVDPQRALEVLQAGPAYAKVMDTKGQKMLTRDFRPEARLAQHWKDVRLMLASAGQNGAHLPFSRVHEELLAAACDRGLGGEDNSAIIRMFAEDAE
jgi:3-hydroxyisobutyrate dehydrogenase-like beta-hydroxyacid dehydrogenase